MTATRRGRARIRRSQNLLSGVKKSAERNLVYPEPSKGVVDGSIITSNKGNTGAQRTQPTNNHSTPVRICRVCNSHTINILTWGGDNRRSWPNSLCWLWHGAPRPLLVVQITYFLVSNGGWQLLKLLRAILVHFVVI